MSSTPISDLIINKLSYNQYKEVVSGNTYNNDQVYQIKDISNTFDTHTGTISNCILEIPQNIKLELTNNIITLKAGSIVTNTGSTYSTLTTTQDTTLSPVVGNLDYNWYYLFNYGNINLQLIRQAGVNSGATLPESSESNNDLFYNTTDKIIYQWKTNTNTWNGTSYRYPIAIVRRKSSTEIEFAKDSNGNDIIFNGACFIGHHAICYPNIKGLLSNELDESGNLKSIKRINNALRIVELNQTYNTIFLTNWSGYFTAHNYMGEVKSIDDLLPNGRYYYVKNINSMCRIYQNSLQENIQITPFISYLYDGTIVTDFTIQQPFRVDKNKSFTYRQW